MESTFDLPYSELVKYALLSYSTIYGMKKTNSIINKVCNSNKISGLISRSRYNNEIPNAEAILCCIAGSSSFVFDSNKTHVFAGIIALQRWNEEVNSSFDFLDDDELKQIVVDMFAEYEISHF